MSNFSILVKEAKKDGSTLFYNSSGLKKAYQLGVKHISSAEFLGFADALPNKDLIIKKTFLLVDFENEEVIRIQKGSRIKPIKLENS